MTDKHTPKCGCYIVARGRLVIECCPLHAATLKALETSEQDKQKQQRYITELIDKRFEADCKRREALEALEEVQGRLEAVREKAEDWVSCKYDVGFGSAGNTVLGILSPEGNE